MTSPAPLGRMLIAGASGTLGGPLAAQAVAAGWDVTATYLTRPERVRAGTPIRLDLRDPDATRDLIESVRPDAIVHAAVTERSGEGFDEAIRLSGRHLAPAAAATGARLVALSTDLVFDGSQAFYTEDSPPQPAANSPYGQAKLDAERALASICPDALIVRTSLIYDFDPANAQVAWMLATLERGETLRLYTDQIRCPIWAVNLADCLVDLVSKPVSGLLHVVGPEPVSRYDLGTALLDALGYDGPRLVERASAPDSHPKVLHLPVDRARAVLSTPLLSIAEARACWERGAAFSRSCK